ncbi:MAG: mechanosensitive ion channel family protein [Gammaproteobacteria bacterium]
MNITDIHNGIGHLATLKSTLWSYGLSFTFALLTLVLGWSVAKIIKKVTRNMLSRLLYDETLGSFLSNVAYTLILLIVFVGALNELGFQTTSLVAILGAMGLAVGLAFKNSLSNFASGIAIIIFKPFKVGDTILVNSVQGKVEELNIFSTRLCSANNQIIYVPNAKLTDNCVTNFSSKPKRRLDLSIAVSYNSDVDRVKTILEELIEAEPLCLNDPKPLIALHEFADSSINFVVRPWSNTSDYWNTYHNLMYAIKKRFDEEGIEIPYPQMDIHMRQDTSLS